MSDTKIEPPRRGRPRNFDAQAGVTAAKQVFHQRGYDAVGVADLCQELGIKPPSLYAAYGSKRELFEQALAAYSEVTNVHFSKVMADATSPDDLRARVLRLAAMLFSRDGGVGCLVLSTLTSTADAELRETLATARRARQDGMAQKLAQLGATKAEIAPWLAAISIALNGMSATARLGADEDELLAGLAALGAL